MRQLRILLLLLLLLFVAAHTWYDQHRTTRWEAPLTVVVYPVNADGSDAAAGQIAGLSRDSFAAIEHFFAEEAGRWGIALAQPLEVYLAPEVSELPPLPPQGGNTLQVMLWSLHLRWWTFRVSGDEPVPPQVRLFALYYDPEQSPRLPHSTGLQKGLVGIAHLFAEHEQDGTNQVVLAHELLHTLGASDKYDLRTNQPLHPAGYAEPEREPLLPQQWAELMAGRIPITTVSAEQPSGLGQTVLGEFTAREIGWID